MLFTRFAAGDLPRIRLSRAVVKAVQAEFAEGKVKMEGFHCGMPALEKLDHAFLKGVKSADHDEKMMMAITLGHKTLIVFGRIGPTNFAESRLTLVEGVPISCSEQVFKLLCVSSHMGISDNCDEVAIKILCAPKPFGAKAATTKLAPFDKGMWDSKSEAAMYASILLICTEFETFARFRMLAALVDEELLVAEANDDGIWGINMFTKPFFMALLDKLTPESDLFAEARALFDGTNKLGEVLTVFLNEIKDMSFEEFKAATADIKFVEIED